MATNFASLAFSPAARALQEKFGSRAAYQRMEQKSRYEGLTKNEREFIGQRDSFYIASIGENGFPYIQHRGGPRGFLNVVDENTLAFADFSGNKQYITAGNLATHANVSLFLMDYPAQTRLKLYARAEIVALNARPDLLKLVRPENYRARPERIVLLLVEAFDWNCPQHITPRYTVEEIEEAMAPQREYIARLEKELNELKSKP